MVDRTAAALCVSLVFCSSEHVLSFSAVVELLDSLHDGLLSTETFTLKPKHILPGLN